MAEAQNDDPNAILQSIAHNLEAAAMCYVRYDSLIEALRARGLIEGQTRDD